LPSPLTPTRGLRARLAVLSRKFRRARFAALRAAPRDRRRLLASTGPGVLSLRPPCLAAPPDFSLGASFRGDCSGAV